MWGFVVVVVGGAEGCDIYMYVVSYLVVSL